MTPADIERARAAGVTDADIVDWAQMAALQTYFNIQADGSGIPLPGDALAGRIVGHDRESYEGAPPGLTAAAPSSAPLASRPDAAGETPCWVDVDTSSDAFQEMAAQARNRWGVVPNLLAAVSGGRAPDLSPRIPMALTLLEGPQSESLSPRLHAMVRALVTSLDRCGYSAATVHQQLADAGADAETYDRVTGDYRQHEWSPTERLVLDFAAKVACNAYKITADDAQAFRDAGLDDEAYVDVYCIAR